MSASERNCAAVVGLYYVGYGVIRELVEAGIRVHAFDSRRNRAEAHTRLAQVTFVDDQEHLTRELLALSDRCAKPPVLYLTSDAYVQYFNTRREVFAGRFLIDFPEPRVVETLLTKDRFADYAEAHGYAIPRTFKVRTLADYERVASDIRYPCVVKPVWHTAAWTTRVVTKVLIFHARADLERRLPALLEVEPNLLVQPYIPGGDDALFFHLAYYRHGRPLAGFTGRKLRQWLPGVGSTTCAEPAPEVHAVASGTVRLFDEVGYEGLGSVEYKYNPLDHRYYIMEPTVGRADLQSAVAYANGVPLSLAGYRALTGLEVEAGLKRPARGKVYWIDDENDGVSILVSALRGRLNLAGVIRSYAGRKRFHLFSFRDSGVFLACWTTVLWGRILCKVREGRRSRGKESERG